MHKFHYHDTGFVCLMGHEDPESVYLLSIDVFFNFNAKIPDEKER